LTDSRETKQRAKKAKISKEQANFKGLWQEANLIIWITSKKRKGGLRTAYPGGMDGKSPNLLVQADSDVRRQKKERVSHKGDCAANVKRGRKERWCS